MPKSTKEHEMSQVLQQAVKNFDLDWIIYQLVQGAVKKRAEADEGGNKGEMAYWQKAVVALNDFQSKCEEL